MFWRVRSPLEAEDEEWQLECWSWLLAHFGGASALLKRKLVRPTREDFSPATEGGHAAALHYFSQVAAHLELDPDTFLVQPQDESVDPVLGPLHIVRDLPSDPAGTFSFDNDGRMRITYNPALLTHPMKLISTLAHEICHPLLLSVPEAPPGGEEMEEFATDLAVTFFGFGLFNANTAATFRQFSDTATGTQGWSFDGQGYLSPAERSFALALFVRMRGDASLEVERYLDSGPLAYYRKANKYLAANSQIASSLKGRYG